MRYTYSDFLAFLGYTLIFSIFFMGYNTVSSPFFETTFDSASIYHTESVVQEIAPAVTKERLVRQLNKPKLTIAFNPEFVQIDQAIVDRLKQNIDSPFFKSKVTPLNLVLDTQREEPRGQVQGNKLILATSVTDESESTKVFVHELGHIIDIFYLKQGIFTPDPSSRFYDISWEAYNIKKKNLKISDFVSGYALSNKYEDFAESFAFYVFHNDTFALKAAKSPILSQKYDFFKTYVFDQNEFIGTSFQKAAPPSYSWDTTKIPINTKKYLYYIR